MDIVQAKLPPPKDNELPVALASMTDIALAKHITTRLIDLYRDQPKDLQVEAVTSLVRGKHTFVRVGTGFGKTRISEMYFGLFEKKVVILVLNPLDSLGDDQVREKKLLNISAINLNKMTLNMVTVEKIKKGMYSFVYLSPEVFLNSSLFTDLFFSEEFQDILSLVVVDEAHMIYLWGLVVSRQSKSLIIFARLEYQAVFRPGYGHLGARIMVTNNIPVLLLSATCRPVAVLAITTSLMLQPRDINMIDGELTRPEIRLIRIPMESTLSSCDDLLRIFAPCSIISAANSVPMIIYSGTRNRTFQVMKVVNEARDTPNHHYDPHDGFIRRYHSVTSDEDKIRVMDDFGAGKVPIISATMALGLGQNLKRVRCVVHMGRGDPAAIGQMVGRCGRDGNIGLGLLFMEPTRKNGRNTVGEFELGTEQNNDSRMDALAVTPVCLRIAMKLDNQLGYVPLDPRDPNVLQERLREEGLGFARFKCSSCAPEDAKSLMNVIQQMTVANFDSLLKDASSIPKDPTIITKTRKRKKSGPKGSCSYPKHVAEDLEQHLLHAFEGFYVNFLGPRAEFAPSVFFGLEEAKAVVASIDQVCTGDSNNLILLEWLVGGQSFNGQIDSHDSAIRNWKNGEFYRHHLATVAELDRFIESEGLRVREEMAASLAILRAEAARQRKAEMDAKALAKSLAKERAAAARSSARMIKAADKVLEQARLQSEKEALKAFREEEKVSKLRHDTQACAVAKAAQKAKHAAENSRKQELKGASRRSTPQHRAHKKMARQAQLAHNLAVRKHWGGPQDNSGEFIAQDTTMVDRMHRDIEQGPNGLPNIGTESAKPKSIGDPMCARAGRIAKSDSVRLNNKAALVTLNCAQSGSHGSRVTRSKFQTRNQHNVARLLREEKMGSAVEAMRDELALGGGE